ncbi:uncharacterized protein HD556DRAFT_1434905 [Suillus plorans]|uniref:Uncharacterized protein n=1 Tax=Suillus plorans TaxID=116603 RepID=A0A9P7ABH8_9AGAM|nr:uncharacterized protein HD556DRAFT_1434905 [Suillus plorans]KAG1785964.1 hypothetical protein HD556DRAFT_1434905 [Suillus plorans]
MQRLCDEVIELIFYELDDPTALTLTSKHFHNVSQDPYVRAHYFLNRYGRMDAMFWALGRGKIMSDKVIDILISSGAYVSRYLVQVAIHHYFRSANHFIKTAWVRNMSIPVFAHFMKVACGLFDEVPLGKNEDDGYFFAVFLKESRLPPDMKSTKWETVRDIFGKYKFIPFSMKDPLMVQLPIALAIEPRLLPYAEANGFHMDTKYRDFVFRKMFEKMALNNGERSDDILRNVRELRRLDARMFLSRTVAAEICMESKSNESAYRALKILDRTKELLFDLSAVVAELIKLFVNTRSITSAYTINVLRHLYADFPSTDPTVRIVMLLTACLSDNVLVQPNPSGTLKSKLEPLGLLPLTRKDIVDILTNPFVEKHSALVDFAKDEMNLSSSDIKDILQEVAVKCLKIGSKGKTLKKLVDCHPYLHAVLQENAVQCYAINLDDLPSYDDEEACATYEAPLCRDFNTSSKATRNSSVAAGLHSAEPNASGDAIATDGREMDEDESGNEGPVQAESGNTSELGIIGQDTLSSMIRQDEMAPTRSRRRSFYFSYFGSDTTGKLGYPTDFIPVGRWVKERYPVRSAMAATFLTHAVINNNTTHFRLLARLGKAPNWCLYHEIENGAEFYFSEEDYLSKQPPATEPKRCSKVKVKSKETSPTIPRLSTQAGPSKVQVSPRATKRRPRRSAAAVMSYVIPDSDDEAIVEDDDENAVVVLMTMQAKKRKVESNLQRWVKHLSVLLAEEQKKYKEKRKRLEKSAPSEGRRRVAKSEFHKSLMVNLRSLRKLDLDKRKQLYGPDAAEDDYFTEDDGDDEYRERTTRANKRRRVTT